MILGIVGSEAAKFTEETEKKARQVILDLIRTLNPKLVVSGGCHLGGIDTWAIEVAKSNGTETKEYFPKNLCWSTGYKPRNIEIATASDVVICITVARLPDAYRGMRFGLCYHCGTKDHVKSGGCWTVRYAKKIGRQGRILVV